MVGYVLGFRKGADVIIDTDDDNLPYDHWAFPNFEGEYDTLIGQNDYLNIYQWFSDQHIWPRGLPLDAII